MTDADIDSVLALWPTRIRLDDDVRTCEDGSAAYKGDGLAGRHESVVASLPDDLIRLQVAGIVYWQLNELAEAAVAAGLTGIDTSAVSRDVVHSEFLADLSDSFATVLAMWPPEIVVGDGQLLPDGGYFPRLSELHAEIDRRLGAWGPERALNRLVFAALHRRAREALASGQTTVRSGDVGEVEVLRGYYPTW